MTKHDIEKDIRKILSENIELEVDVTQLDGHEELANFGMNSTSILKCIMAMEQEFGFEVNDDDFDSQNFMTINSLV